MPAIFVEPNVLMLVGDEVLFRPARHAVDRGSAVGVCVHPIRDSRGTRGHQDAQGQEDSNPETARQHLHENNRCAVHTERLPPERLIV